MQLIFGILWLFLAALYTYLGFSTGSNLNFATAACWAGSSVFWFISWKNRRNDELS